MISSKNVPVKPIPSIPAVRRFRRFEVYETICAKCLNRIEAPAAVVDTLHRLRCECGCVGAVAWRGDAA